MKVPCKDRKGCGIDVKCDRADYCSYWINYVLKSKTEREEEKQSEHKKSK